jgi:hypothetical protein
MAIEFTSTSQVTATHGVKCAVFGNAGVGKTALMATAPRPFLIAVEPGLIVLKPANIIRMYGANTPGICYDVPVAKIKHVNGASPLPQVREVYKAFQRRDPWTLQIDTIGLDSISQLAEWELAYQMTQTPNGQKAYGMMADEILEVIRDFVCLPDKHCVFTAKQSVSAHSGLYSAAFPGQLMDYHFPYEFDCTLQLCVTEGIDGTAHRFLRTQPDFKNFSKDRTGALDPKGESPYLYNIFSKISAA